MLQLVSGRVREIEGTFALEVSFAREPDDTELGLLTEAIPALCRAGGETRRDLPGLARLTLNASLRGAVVAGGDDSEDKRERLGVASAIVMSTGTKHISVRMPHTDLRAETFLNAEARQPASGDVQLLYGEETRGGIQQRRRGDTCSDAGP